MLRGRRLAAFVPLGFIALNHPSVFCSPIDRKGLPEIIQQPPNRNGIPTHTPLYLTGVGMRKKNFWVVDVDVYITGLSLSSHARDRAIQWRTAEQEKGKSLADVLDEFNDKHELGHAKALVTLKFVRNVATANVQDAFNDAFHDLDPMEVARFKSSLSESIGLEGMKKGEEVCFVFMNGGGLVVTVNGKVRDIFRSPMVEKRLLGVYVDPKYTVSPSLLESVVSNLGADAALNVPH